MPESGSDLTTLPAKVETFLSEDGVILWIRFEHQALVFARVAVPN